MKRRLLAATPPFMENKVVLITGANAGIGKATAKALASKGAIVVCSARDKARGEAAVAEIQRESRNASVHLLLADLSTVDSTRRLARAFEQQFERLDVLINNAGLVLGERRETADGLEMTFAVNHLAPFVLTDELLPLLIRSAPSRIINVASEAHRRAGINFDDLQGEKRYNGAVAYCRSKLCNILFTHALAERVANRGITVNSLHPGVVRTSFAQDGDVPGIIGKIFNLLRPLMTSPEKGARTSVYLATSTEVADVSGKYFSRCKVAQPSQAARSDAHAERLWSISEDLVRNADAQASSAPH